ncbi:hypothetical protein SAMN04488544_0132 [Microlunatus sagamiharensis]|uniref:Uncharacterized protein n=1 Tax=Microlunatus sagamiharensis TaxID=546874 RepID=A0A1H2LH99_9ACTN|nr:hypothetical protein [Microlunatus sagamiharensis]SDU80184.1 hypothetical protein SAMN04488544_0132 [Microlunatus sagamiharensis]
MTGSATESRMLAIYLRDHAAAARGGADLFQRMRRSQGRRPWGRELESLDAEVLEDLRSLRRLMHDWDVAPDPWTTLAVRLGERVGRLKPNGRILRRSPLSDLLEVEAGLDAVHAKAAGWEALRAARTPPTEVDLDDLARRAADQVVRLTRVHASVAAATL